MNVRTERPQGTQRPRVTLCVPNYNMGDYLGAAIESGLSQTYGDLEVLVLDNASTDSSWEVAQALAARDPRVRLLRNDRTVRVYHNWNRCLEAATGEFALLLSADDLLEPTFLERCLALFDGDAPGAKDLAYVFAERRVIDGEGREQPHPAFYDRSGVIPGVEEARINIIGGHIAPVQVLFRRETMAAVGNYDDRFEWAFDLHGAIKLSLSSPSARVGYVQDKLCRYRVHPANVTSAFHRRKYAVLELHRIKNIVLDELPPHAAHLESLRPQVARRLARWCLDFTRQFHAQGDHVLAAEYLALSAALHLDIREDPAHRFLTDYFARSPRSAPQHLTEAWDEFSAQRAPGAPMTGGAPYPLPPGSEPV